MWTQSSTCICYVSAIIHLYFKNLFWALCNIFQLLFHILLVAFNSDHLFISQACFICKQKFFWRCVRCEVASHDKCAAWPEKVIRVSERPGWAVCWRHPKDWRQKVNLLFSSLASFLPNSETFHVYLIFYFCVWTIFFDTNFISLSLFWTSVIRSPHNFHAALAWHFKV